MAQSNFAEKEKMIGQNIQFDKLLSETELTNVIERGVFNFLRRELCWGRNYTKGMTRRLRKTQWIPIYQLSTDHIRAILDTQFLAPPVYQAVMETELICRMARIAYRNLDFLLDLTHKKS